MKVVLRIFIPLCIFSFIAFGISVMFLGTQPITADTAISELTISDSGANTYDITDSFTSIRADIGAYKLTIKPWSENKTQVTVSGDKSSRIKAGVSGDRLTLNPTGAGAKTGTGACSGIFSTARRSAPKCF